MGLQQLSRESKRSRQSACFALLALAFVASVSVTLMAIEEEAMGGLVMETKANAIDSAEFLWDSEGDNAEQEEELEKDGSTLSRNEFWGLFSTGQGAPNQGHAVQRGTRARSPRTQTRRMSREVDADVDDDDNVEQDPDEILVETSVKAKKHTTAIKAQKYLQGRNLIKRRAREANERCNKSKCVSQFKSAKARVSMYRARRAAAMKAQFGATREAAWKKQHTASQTVQKKAQASGKSGPGHKGQRRIASGMIIKGLTDDKLRLSSALQKAFRQAINKQVGAELDDVVIMDIGGGAPGAKTIVPSATKKTSSKTTSKATPGWIDRMTEDVTEQAVDPLTSTTSLIQNNKPQQFRSSIHVGAPALFHGSPGTVSDFIQEVHPIVEEEITPRKSRVKVPGFLLGKQDPERIHKRIRRIAPVETLVQAKKDQGEASIKFYVKTDKMNAKITQDAVSAATQDPAKTGLDAAFIATAYKQGEVIQTTMMPTSTPLIEYTNPVATGTVTAKPPPPPPAKKEVPKKAPPPPLTRRAAAVSATPTAAPSSKKGSSFPWLIIFGCIVGAILALFVVYQIVIWRQNQLDEQEIMENAVKQSKDQLLANAVQIKDQARAIKEAYHKTQERRVSVAGALSGQLLQVANAAKALHPKLAAADLEDEAQEMTKLAQELQKMVDASSKNATATQVMEQRLQEAINSANRSTLQAAVNEADKKISTGEISQPPSLETARKTLGAMERAANHSGWACCAPMRPCEDGARGRESLDEEATHHYQHSNLILSEDALLRDPPAVAAPPRPAAPPPRGSTPRGAFGAGYGTPHAQQDASGAMPPFGTAVPAPPPPPGPPQLARSTSNMAPRPPPPPPR